MIERVEAHMTCPCCGRFFVVDCEIEEDRTGLRRVVMLSTYAECRRCGGPRRLTRVDGDDTYMDFDGGLSHQVSDDRDDDGQPLTIFILPQV